MKYIIRESNKQHRTIFTSFRCGTHARKLGCRTQKQIDERVAELNNHENTKSFYILEFDNDHDAQIHCKDLNMIFSEVF